MPNWANLDEEDAFINQYGAELNRMEEKIDNATWTDSDNPADQVKAYEKALDLCDKLGGKKSTPNLTRNSKHRF